MPVMDTAEQGRRREDSFFEIRANILALVEGIEKAEAVCLLASAMNERLAPGGYGATVLLRCLASSEGNEKTNQPHLLDMVKNQLGQKHKNSSLEKMPGIIRETAKALREEGFAECFVRVGILAICGVQMNGAQAKTLALHI